MRLTATFMATIPLIIIAGGFSTLCFLTALNIVDVAADGATRWWFLPFGLLFGFVAAGLLLSELSTHLGHIEIQVGQGVLKSTLCLGRLRWSQQCTLDSVKRLNLPDEGCDFGTELHGGELVAELNHSGGTDTFVLARSYPRPWLMQVGQWLSTELSRQSLSATDSPVQLVSETQEDRLQKARTDRPANSSIREQRYGDELVLYVPPTGAMAYGGGVGAMCGVMAAGLLPVGAILAANLDVEGLVVGLVFVSCIFVFALCVCLRAVNAAYRRTTITVTPLRLMIVQKALFGHRSFSWDRNEIANVRIGASQYAVSPPRDREGKLKPSSSFFSPGSSRYEQRQIAELQIIPLEGAPLGLLPGRDEGELRWMATVLQQELQTFEP